MRKNLHIPQLVAYICFNKQLNDHNIMILTQKALTAIDEPQRRLKLALALSFSETWIRSLIAANKDNGPLTTAVAMQVIKQETGLLDEEILEASKKELQGTTGKK